MIEGSDSILITLSRDTIKARKGGYRQIAREWLASDGENSTWWYKCGTAPKDPDSICWVYWVIAGRVRWRCKLLQVERDRSMVFNGREDPIYARAWLVLFDFEQLPKRDQVERKGFQGFRYYQPVNY